MLTDFQKRSLLQRNKAKTTSDITDRPDILKVFEHCTFDSPQKRSGRALITICPFHDDSKPSFALYEDTNSAYCFSCGWSGDSFQIIKELKSMDFLAAKEYAIQNGLYK